MKKKGSRYDDGRQQKDLLSNRQTVSSLHKHHQHSLPPLTPIISSSPTYSRNIRVHEKEAKRLQQQQLCFLCFFCRSRNSFQDNTRQDMDLTPITATSANKPQPVCILKTK